MRRLIPRRHFSDTVLRKTALYDFHVRNGGKMVPFAGWSMPVQYQGFGILQSHLHTRKAASIFDVSHMLQSSISGKDRYEFLEHLVVAHVSQLPLNQAQLSVFTNKNGGIIDDTMITRRKDDIYVVSNAGCADKVIEHIKAHEKSFKAAGKDVSFTPFSHLSLIALQGPLSAPVLEKLKLGPLNKIPFLRHFTGTVANIPVGVTRCGYTGEDGFEISVPHEKVEELVSVLMLDNNVQLAGLGPRDSLRLEAGLCLYGHDIDETTSPVEAGLSWLVPKSRRSSPSFLGSDRILKELKSGTTRKRVGLIVDGAPARENAEIYYEDVKIGTVTSGGPSPSSKQNIAMGYVTAGNEKVGTNVFVKVRERLQSATVVKMPFVATNYFKPE